MKAAVFEKEGVLVVKDVPKPQIMKEDEVIIEVELCSICGTDVHIMATPPGYPATPNTILGHELVGKVVEIGTKVSSVTVGDRVVVNPNDYCGTCDYCKNNQPNFCTSIEAMGIDVNGGFAEFVKTSEKVVYKISDSLPAEIAAFAEPLACLLNGTKKLRVNPGESVVVIGAGTIGLMFIQMMKAAGAYPIIVSEPNVNRRSFAVKSGADFVVDPTETDIEGFVKNIVPLGADYAIEVVGSQMMPAIKTVRKGGTVLLFGVNSKAVPQVVQSRITQYEIDVKGTWIANATFPLAVKILESGVLNLKQLITHTFALEDTSKGIQTLASGEGVEIFIDPRL